MKSELISFKEFLLKAGYRLKTVYSYGQDVLQFMNWLEEEQLEESQLSYGDVLSYLKILGKKYTNRTVGNKVLVLRHYFNYLGDRGILLENPARGLEIQGKKTRTLYEILSVEKLDEIYRNYEMDGSGNSWSYGKKSMLGLIVYQGLNSGMLSRILEEDLDLRKGEICIRRTGKSNGRVLKLEAHQVYELLEYMREYRERILEKWGKSSDKLFVKNYLNKEIGELLLELRLRDSVVKSVKQLRASVITNWLKRYNLREVQYMAGHRYISTTEGYKQNDMEGLIEAVGKYHPLGCLKSGIKALDLDKV